MQREDWDRRYAQPGLLWSARPNRFLVAEVGELPAGRALDLACGEGQNARWLAERGWTVTGVDFSEVAIRKARARADEERLDIECVCADLVDYEPARAAYDLVAILYLHVARAEHRVILERAAAAVAPGGTLLVVGHDVRNPTEGVGGPQDESLLYSPEDLAEQLPGLEIVKAERVLRDVPGADRPAIDALVRAVRRRG